MIQALFRCLEVSECGQNQTKVVLLRYGPFMGEIEESYLGGEAIWARSTRIALRSLGYTYIYSPNNERTLQLYHIFRGLVKAIFLDGGDTNACFKDAKCILSPQNPSGIPVWKMFSFNWWTGAEGPLGHKWTLNPEDYQLEGKGYTPNTYLGYSVEPGCSMRPFIPHSERKRQGYVMAKEMKYFGPDVRAWDPESYQLAHEAAEIDFVAGVRGPESSEFPSSHSNLGYLSQTDFYHQLSRSLVLVGVGPSGPATSPTPYDALCFGVPFINPIRNWDKRDPTNRDKWDVQHGMLKYLNPPYIYHVFKGDHDGFVNAVKDAVTHPIERCDCGCLQLDRMRMQSVEQRVGQILSTDWEMEALKLSDEKGSS
ncbi:hypothetical protein C8J57DRAFT_1588283 [Mycena rebaudengoi]|nr:hypothetical protein C8J57DRAFT_1588283 [Mycena rebaudengoi]